MKKHSVRLVALLLVVALFTLVACNNTKDKLATPQNVQVSASGLITWDYVPNATEYVVSFGGVEYKTASTKWQIPTDFASTTKFSVYATAPNMTNSDPSPEITYTGGGVNPPVGSKLATPQNLTISESGVISWTHVANAQNYTLTVGNDEWIVEAITYQVPTSKLQQNFQFSVVANAVGYTSSDAAIKNYAAPYELVIEGAKTVKHGQSVTLTAIANPSVTDVDVTWQIVSGGDYATISDGGVLTAERLQSGTSQKIVVKATSTTDATKVATKELTIITPSPLTQDMLDELDHNKLSFDSILQIDFYEIGIGKYFDSMETTSMTAMDGTYWYAEYVDETIGVGQLYYANHNGTTSQVTLSFLNEEQFIPVIDSENQLEAWEKSGLYNSLRDLNLNDFVFDEESWMWRYMGGDTALMDRVIAAATPYEFVPAKFGFVVEDGIIMELYAEAMPDNGMLAGYRAEQTLHAVINVGDGVVVPRVQKLTYNPELEAQYTALQTAINNMQSLDSYTVNFEETTSTAAGTYTTGTLETITDGLYHIVPYTLNAQYQKVFNENGATGFKRTSDDPNAPMYNTYYRANVGTDEVPIMGYAANRAYADDIENAKPSFAFAPEIFTVVQPQTDGSTVYFVNSAMCPVASTFYYSADHYVQLYGIFATEAAITSFSSFRTYVQVKDGYIVESGFYFYTGSMYGYVQITYGDFNTATIENAASITFEEKVLPTKWSQMVITDTHLDSDSSSTGDDTEVNALTYLQTYLGLPDLTDDQAKQYLPFFGDVLGDSYGFGLTMLKIGSDNLAHSAIGFYYDVPLDIDYTINESMRKVQTLLIESGFVKDARTGEYTKTIGEKTVVIAPSDAGLDLNIYFWIK